MHLACKRAYRDARSTSLWSSCFEPTTLICVYAGKLPHVAVRQPPVMAVMPADGARYAGRAGHNAACWFEPVDAVGQVLGIESA